MGRRRMLSVNSPDQGIEASIMGGLYGGSPDSDAEVCLTIKPRSFSMPVIRRSTLLYSRNQDRGPCYCDF